MLVNKQNEEKLKYEKSSGVPTKRRQISPRKKIYKRKVVKRVKQIEEVWRS